MKDSKHPNTVGLMKAIEPPDIKPTPSVDVTCSKIQIVFYLDQIIDGKKAAEFKPFAATVFPVDFDKPCDFSVLAKDACLQAKSELEKRK